MLGRGLVVAATVLVAVALLGLAVPSDAVEQTRHRHQHGHGHRHGHRRVHHHHKQEVQAETQVDAERTGEGAQETSGLQTAEGEDLTHDQAFSLILEKSSVSEMERAQFLMMLKAVRATLITVKGDKAAAASLLESGNEPLQMQVLSEKRLATYFGKIQIGQCVDKDQKTIVECNKAEKRKMTFKALFDTGSCEFWMPNHNCPQNTKPASRCDKHTLYHESPTYKYRVNGAGPFSEDQKMCIQYLSGKIEGFMAKDTIRVGSFDVNGQVFGMADTIDVPLLDEVVWDGIVGLAYPNEKLKKSGVVPLFDNMMATKNLPNNVFSYYIGQSSGAVTFGGVDPAYFDMHDKNPGLFRYAVVTEQSYWTIDIVDVELQFGDNPPQSTGVCQARPKDEGDPAGEQLNPNNRCKAIVDTGTYLIYGPRESVTTKLSSVALNDGCASIGNLPKVTFVFYAGDNAKPARLTLQPHDYTLEFIVPRQAQSFLEEGGMQGLRGKETAAAAAAAGVSVESLQRVRSLHSAARRLKRMKKSDNACNTPENRQNSDICTRDCVIGIGPDNDPGWTLGQVFLRSFYTVFDRDQNKVGFVRSNPRGDTEKAEKQKKEGKQVHEPPKPLYGSLATTGVVTEDGK